MRQSNGYILMYAAAITIVCGGMLAFASSSLKERQLANIALAQKKNILGTAMELKEEDDIEALYAQRITSFVVDYSGNVKQDVAPEEVKVAVEFKKDPKDRLLPVYEFMNAHDTTKVESVVLPVYGNGLWKNIWGFIALKGDLNTLRGVKFEHAGETPGLGARMTSDDIQDRYKDKLIFDHRAIASVVMQKGEGVDYDNDPHKVDGMSGATLTAKGINDMLMDYFVCYQNYIQKKSVIQNP